MDYKFFGKVVIRGREVRLIRVWWDGFDRVDPGKFEGKWFSNYKRYWTVSWISAFPKAMRRPYL